MLSWLSQALFRSRGVNIQRSKPIFLTIGMRRWRLRRSFLGVHCYGDLLCYHRRFVSGNGVNVSISAGDAPQLAPDYADCRIISAIEMFSSAFKHHLTLSRAPTSGGQYHWVSEFAPPKYQKYLSYASGRPRSCEMEATSLSSP
jgi:hypothetical protein